MAYDAFKHLDKTEDVVRKHLKDNIVCRDSTTFLEYLVLKEYYEAVSDKSKQCKTEAFLSDLYDLLHYAPNTETIQRARRKVQNKYKEFRPSKKIQQQRLDRMDDYSDYGLAD
jgi:hypothetical protein